MVPLRLTLLTCKMGVRTSVTGRDAGGMAQGTADKVLGLSEPSKLLHDGSKSDGLGVCITHGRAGAMCALFSTNLFF